ncbi:MAG: alpha/beta fold hydrolase [Alphaproteobacteria bacterium]|nr:alpha/beta fold hydrolase [Silvanigrellaceae bacterium]MBX9787253.1 alpha/beta fold hydrolase [Alphaproteobacteria bacterium]
MEKGHNFFGNSLKETYNFPLSDIFLYALSWQEKELPEKLIENSKSLQIILQDEDIYFSADQGLSFSFKNFDIDKLLSILQAKGKKDITIIHLWSFSSLEDEENIENYQKKIYKTQKFLFLITKSLLNADFNPHYFFFYPRNQDYKTAINSSVAGFFKSLVLEHPNIGAKSVAIDSSLISELSTIIQKEIWHDGKGFQEVLYKNNKRYLRLITEEPSFRPNNKHELLRKNGVYIITGGLGKIGQSLSEFLLGNYSARIVLVGRNECDKQRQKILEKLKAKGGQICYFVGDITDYHKTKELINFTIDRFGEINGVIHSAGVIKDKLLKSKSEDDFDAVLSPKFIGTLNLDEATKQIPIDFFALFSSISSITGNLGQTDYAMANCFLDSFAPIREGFVKEGKRYGKTISFNWALWESSGSFLTKEQKDFMFNQHGILPIDDLNGMKVFVEGMNSDITQAIIVKGDKNKISEVFKSTVSSYINNVVSSELKADVLEKPRIDSNYSFQIIREGVSEILKIPLERIDNHITFGDFGFESISLQKFSDYLSSYYEPAIPPNAFFTYNTINKLEEYIKHKFKSKAIDSLNILNKVDDISYIQPVSIGSSFEKDKIKESSRGEKDLIAIVGMSGILPDASNLKLFWQNLIESRNAIRPIKRWPNRNYYGGVVDEYNLFDPKFFGLSAREAMLMDPQHRLFLEVSYNAFLDAGYVPELVGNKKIGIFAGVQFNDYQFLLQDWKQSRHPYAATGNAHAMVANRFSYLFDFRGPSETLDTACSSAFVALRRAMIALERNECEMALAGAVSLMLDHEITDAATTMSILSPRHACRTFDAGADGYVRGEGVGCVLLKRYSDAVRDKDFIHGVILACEENHGGRSHSLTAPNPEAQTDLLIESYKSIDIKTISYIETHGTGTKLGDPIEVDALKKAWGVLSKGETLPLNTVGLGSVKTHIGHLEPAAGIASLLKVLLCLKHKQLPGNLHFETLNPYIQLEESPFYVLKEAQPWLANFPRRAGISSFGFGGSNAHLVIEEAPSLTQPENHGSDAYFLIALSAKNEASLEEMQKNLVTFLKEEMPDEYPYTLENIAYTLNCGRSHFNCRRVFIVQNIKDLQEQLDQKDCGFSVSSNPENNILVEFAKAYLDNQEVDFKSFHKNHTQQKIPLPTYHFSHSPYWFDTASDIDTVVEEQKEKIVEGLVDIFAQALLCDKSEIKTQIPYVDLGVDSMLAIQIVTLIQKKLQVNLNPTDLFKFIDIKRLAEYITESIGRTKTPSFTKTEKTFVEASKSPQDPIAIIGFSGRFSKADTVWDYWEALREGKDLIYTSEKRWNTHPELFGGFLNDIDLFDAEFFNISPNEAIAMDPQQRLFLEEGFRALEIAGYRKKDLDKIKCGVFVGCLPGDYRQILADGEDVFSRYNFTGNTSSILAARISYFLNLRGPSIALDTACSSSLVALHLAVQEMQSKNIDMALIGGTAVYSTPEFFNFANNYSMLSPKGKCYSFSQDADGFIPGEGVAALILKPLSQAIAHKDYIYGVIHASGVNQDGRTNGIAAPSQEAQAQLISELYERYNINWKDVAYIEAHGTGTKLGDAIEIKALNDVINTQHPDSLKIPIGTSKTNIGHCLTASGMASLLKSLFCLNYKKLVPSINYSAKNEFIDFGSLYVNTALEEIPSEKKYVAVSAFGFSGTNAHVVIENGASYCNQISINSKKAYPIILSSHAADTLEKYKKNFIDWLKSDIAAAPYPISLENLSYTLCCCRTVMKYRWSTIVYSLDELLDHLINKNTFSATDDIDLNVIKLVNSYQQGEEVNWDEHFQEDVYQKIITPPYVYNQKSFWARSKLPVNSAISNLPNEENLTEKIKKIVARVTGVSIHDIQDNSNFHLFGIDSLVALQLLKETISPNFKVSPQIVFEYPTPKLLANHLQSILSSNGLESRDRNIIGTSNNIDYFNIGKGEKKILMLCPLNTKSNIWTEQIKSFEKNFEILIPHYPGHGVTPFSKKSIYNISLEILDHFSEWFKEGPVHIIGWSLGGCIAQIMAAKKPAAFSSMTLINTDSHFPADIFSKMLDLLEEIDLHKDSLAKIYNVPVEKVLETLKATSKSELLEHYYRELTLFNWEDNLTNIKVPTLVISGEKDSIIPVKNAEILAANIRGSELHIIKNAGHFLPLTHAQILENILIKFWTNHG